MPIEVDDQDLWLLSKYEWSIQKTTPSYAFRHETINGKNVRIYLHREILGATAGVFVDHVDGNGLNCRRSNIRPCTHAENMRNRKVAKSNKLGVKGVWAKRGAFAAEIQSAGVRYSLGSYPTLAEAAKAYADAALRLHGKFSRSQATPACSVN